MTAVESEIARSEPVDPSAAGEPVPVPTEPARSTHRHGRLVVVLAIAAVIALVLIDVLAGRLAFTARQDHLAGAYNDPTIEAADRGAPLMVLQVENLKANVVVAEGSDADILRGGPGLMAGSPLPGEDGNAVILGRSTRFGAPFAFVKDLEKGSVIDIRLRDTQVVRYEVTKVSTVSGTDERPLRQTDDARLTLVTSAGLPLDSRRRVVTAKLTGASAGATAPAADEAESTAADPTTADPAGAAAAPDAETPKDEPDKAAARDPGEPPGTYDVRAPATFLLLLVGFLVIAVGILAIGELRKRHPVATVVVVAVPAIALGVMLVLFNLDAILPVTY